jgi:hypothetical protein
VVNILGACLKILRARARARKWLSTPLIQILGTPLNIIIMVAVVDTLVVKITIIKHLISSTTVYIVHPNLTYSK